MICKNCSTEYDDTESRCPECGENREEKFVVSIPDENGAEAAGAVSAEAETPAYGIGENVQTAAETEMPQKQTAAPEILKSKGKRRVRKRTKAVRNSDIQVSPKEKKFSLVIMLIMCVIGAIAVALVGVKVGTDTLETTAPEDKAVATVGFTAQEEAELEKILAASYSALKLSYNSERDDCESFLARVNPADPGNFYTLAAKQNAVLQTQEDPALRFENENGEYSYYKIEASEIDTLLSRFSISACHEVNTKNYYYYDGSYYFAPVESENTTIVSADVTKNKKVLDGSYYVECYFYAAKENDTTVKSETYYLVVEKLTDAQNGTFSFVVKKADVEPIFDDSGSLIQKSGVDSYKIKKEVIEGRADDGTLYCKYVFEYPVIEGKDAGSAAAVQFLSDTLNVYKLRAQSAQEDYKNFISNGGNKEELPFTETVMTRVTFDDDSRIAITEKISSYSPELPVAQEETTEAEDDYSYEDYYYEEETPEKQGVKLFDRSVEGYVFDKVTGDFVTKDMIVGKDYMLVSEILYRIYNSYDYEMLLTEAAVEETTTQADSYEEDYYDDYYEDEYYYGEEEVEDGIPDDEDGFGTLIYESGFSLTEEGLCFCYITSGGYIEEVVIPHSVLEKLAE